MGKSIMALAGVACCLLALTALPATGSDSRRQTQAALWQSLANGSAVALMRHATAPGFGDPEAFSLADCSTQRNLSGAGRAEARAIGKSMRAHGIEDAVVRSGQWCRCLDTARLLGFGTVIPTPALNSFFQQRDRAQAQTATALGLLTETGQGHPHIWVTHQVNITALTGLSTASGEIVVVEPRGRGVHVLGRIAASAH